MVKSLQLKNLKPNHLNNNKSKLKYLLMKHIVLSCTFLLVTGLAFGQKANIKKVNKEIASENPNFNVALTAIEAAMQDPTTKNNPETYNIAARLHLKAYEQESRKQHMSPKQAYDTVRLYNSVLEMFKYYQLCDDAALKPDEKGKMRKNKWREPNREELRKYHDHLFYGGASFYMQERKDYPQAIHFLSKYLEVTEMPMLQGLNLLSDSTIATVSFYITYSAHQAKDYPKVIKYGQNALQGTNQKDIDFAQDMLIHAYRETKDTVNWILMLEENIKRNPSSESSIVQLINYYNEKGQQEKAFEFADKLIVGDPQNAYGYFIKGVLFQNMERYSEAIEQYKKALEINTEKAEYRSNLGACYIGIAQEIDATAKYGDPNYREEQRRVSQNYLWAKEEFEKAKELAPEKEDLWVAPLYRIYYRLGIRAGEEFEELQQKMDARATQ